MNLKKTIIYLLLSIFVLIFVYNYVLPYVLFQNNVSSKMGMHMGRSVVNSNVYYYRDFISIIIMTILVIIGLVIFNNMTINTKNNICKKCGQTVESDQWRICPRCGTNLSNKGDDKQ